MASNRSERVRNRYGICLNDSCSKCKGKEVQEVPARKDFVCAECGKPLRECPPPRSWWDKHGKKVIGGIVVALLAAGGACVALLGGGETPPPPPTPQVDTPVINPESGEYKNTIMVTLDCATDSVNIYYTLNGEEPSDVSALYSEPIQIDKSTTIKVIACRPGYINSNVSVAEFTILPTPPAPPTPQVETPVISLESGEYKKAVKVTLDCATDSVNIYYTLNGEEPSDVSALYSEPIQIDKTTTIKVIACRPGYINSNVSVAEFTISKGKNPNPTGDGSGKRYKGTLNLGYGRYSGDIVDGKPDGAGVLTYTKQQKVVSTKDVVAEPGERIEGVFENGKASFVTLYKKDGNTIKVHR